MKLGIVGLLPEWHQIDLAAALRVRAAGFRGASIVFGRPLEADVADLLRLKHALGAADLEAAQANGWFECLVNPDSARRAEGVRGLQALTRIGRYLNAATVYVRPGSLSPTGHWYPHPGNHLPETFDRLVDSLRQAAATAAAEGMTLALEGHVLSPLDTPGRVQDVLAAVGSPALKFNLDLVNFVGSVGAAHNPTPLMKQLFAALGDETAALHIKDCALQDALVLHIQEVMLGTGTVDLGLLVQRAQAACPDAYCLIEHLTDEQVPRARDVFNAAAERAGVHWVN
jgi:sugar phosphate isomerase/epimerase